MNIISMSSQALVFIMQHHNKLHRELKKTRPESESCGFARTRWHLELNSNILTVTDDDI